MNKAPLISYVSEEEQARLTLASRFVTGSRVLPSETVAHMLRNENQEMIPELISVVARLSRGQCIALKSAAESNSPNMPIPPELAKHWENHWKTVYDIEADFSGLIVPRPPTLFGARLVVMHEKGSGSPEFLYRASAKLMAGSCGHWKFYGKQSLDETVPKHNFMGTFGCWVEDADDAPYGCIGGINLSTDAVHELREQFGLHTTTLPVRLVLGTDVFLENGSKKQLDRKVVTVCAESETVSGGVPLVFFDCDYGEVFVCGWNSGSAYGGCIRFRRAVYLVSQT